jgi:MFS superfamily sulfate permease-like transporter
LADYGKNGWPGSYRSQKNNWQANDGQATGSRDSIAGGLTGCQRFPSGVAWGGIMNLEQKIALWLGAANLAVIGLFPPFDSFSFTDTKALIFAGFHFRFARGVNEVINGDVLFLEIVVLLVNVAIVWLLSRDVKNIIGTTRRDVSITRTPYC